MHIFGKKLFLHKRPAPKIKEFVRRGKVLMKLDVQENHNICFGNRFKAFLEFKRLCQTFIL